VSIEQRLRELGLELPAVPSPAANYANAVRTGNLVFLSGAVPTTADGEIPKGKVGADVTTEEAAEHARLVGLNLLAVLKQELGDLDRVRRVVKLLGMVNAVPDFREQSKVTKRLLGPPRRGVRRAACPLRDRRRQPAVRDHGGDRGGRRGRIGRAGEGVGRWRGIAAAATPRSS
jgi:enamine deaminase RidA (YjgF/YER057c/UK114 family)